MEWNLIRPPYYYYYYIVYFSLEIYKCVKYVIYFLNYRVNITKLIDKKDMSKTIIWFIYLIN